MMKYIAALAIIGCITTAAFADTPAAGITILQQQVISPTPGAVVENTQIVRCLPDVTGRTVCVWANGSAVGR